MLATYVPHAARLHTFGNGINLPQQLPPFVLSLLPWISRLTRTNTPLQATPPSPEPLEGATPYHKTPPSFAAASSLSPPRRASAQPPPPAQLQGRQWALGSGLEGAVRGGVELPPLRFDTNAISLSVWTASPTASPASPTTPASPTSSTPPASPSVLAPAVPPAGQAIGVSAGAEAHAAKRPRAASFGVAFGAAAAARKPFKAPRLLLPQLG